jgi:cytochrome c oxidase cbb3-type subunit 3
MRILETARVPLTIVALSAAAYHLAHGTQAPATQSRPGTQPTYFVEHPDHVQLGLSNRGRWATLANPYAKDPRRAAEGAKLFIAYNCLDCHGADGSGAMGPSLQDSRWHFGGTPGEIFQSIYEGRPDGMPSWGGRIDDAEIWRLVAYVQTLSKGHDVTTENFTGKTVARTGH